MNKDFLDFLDRCIKKDKDAWENFVETYGRLIYNHIIRTLRRYFYPFQDDDLEEIFNIIFLALIEDNFKRLKNFRGQNEPTFASYLRKISFNTCIDFLRERRNLRSLEEIQNCVNAKDSDETLDRKDLREIIRIARDELPERHHYLFKLIYEEDFDLSEISEILNLKLNAVHQLKYRMIKNFIKIIKEKNLYQELNLFLTDFSPSLSMSAKGYS